MPGPEDIQLWEFVQNRVAEQYDPFYAAAVEQFGVSVAKTELGGVPALDVRPDNWSEAIVQPGSFQQSTDRVAAS